MLIGNGLKNKLLTIASAKEISDIQLVQGVWGGYGELLRIFFLDSALPSLIVKSIRTPQPDMHPKGWNTDLSHQRKLTSYQVEAYWYQHYAHLHAHRRCYLPRCLHIEQQADQQLLVLEDLGANGYPHVKDACTLQQAKTCLSWLAEFHALHLQRAPQGLWQTGSYWHLATRPDELANLKDAPLKKAATHIDQRLANAPYQTLIHGDAKLANFCFSEDGQQVAGVDFQYVGQGCGMKDVILFISSAVAPEDCAQQAPTLLDHYCSALKVACDREGRIAGDKVVDAWRPLYALAWADFQRFVKGWSPNHWKINAYSEGLTQQALGTLDAFFDTTT